MLPDFDGYVNLRRGVLELASSCASEEGMWVIGRLMGDVIGTKFLVFAEPHQPNIDVVCRRVYELYADYVMKNPFYQIEMPIRCESFDRHLMAYIKPKQ